MSALNIRILKLSVCLFLVSLAGGAVAADDRQNSLLSRSYPLEKVKQLVAEKPQLALFPKISGRRAWRKLPESIRRGLVQRGEKSLDYRYHGLSASDYLDDVKNGSYKNSRAIAVAARRHLNNMVIAECIEDKGRFLGPIIDVLWMIAEESSWTSLSHFYLHKEGDLAKLELALPDVSDPLVDLWSATTAKNFAWTYYLLGERFDAITPRINDRIKFEVNRRVLDPAITRDDFWWMGFSGDNRGIVNNWNPWISSNWLAATLLIEDPEQQAATIHKLLRVVDKFIDSYAQSGGIDEGPSYWGRAAGSLFDILSLLYTWSGGEIDIYQQPKIRNMMQYIYRAHIHGDYAVNFTDAPARLKPDADLLYRIGVQIGDEKMKQFAALFRVPESSIEGDYYPEFKNGQPDLDRELYPLFYPGLASQQANAPYVRDSWYPRVEHMMARSREDSGQGFFVAAKGGHNNESHNHNDVGNFIVYHNGEPVLIDAGAGSYTLKTFGDDRYTLWNMQSGYHNVPTINGQQQQPGEHYRAKGVSYKATDQLAQMSMDIAGAYPASAGVGSWRRTVSLHRPGEGAGRVTLQEQIRLAKKRGKTTLNFLTLHPVKVLDGELLIDKPDDAIIVDYPGRLFDASVEEIPLSGSSFAKGWQTDTLYRIVLKLKDKHRELAWTIELRESE